MNGAVDLLSGTSEVRRRVLQALAALILAALLGFALLRPFGPDHHPDGGGPLGSVGRDAWEMKGIDPSGDPGVSACTFGVPLCVATGTADPILESVSPSVVVGDGFSLQGLTVRQFVRSAGNEGINSVSGWPPSAIEVPHPQSPVTAFVVTTRCATTYEPPSTELLIGFGKTGPAGGGWTGIDVAYSVAGREYLLHVRRDIYICGTSTVAQCTLPASP
jgi:hypothetical protein